MNIKNTQKSIISSGYYLVGGNVKAETLNLIEKYYGRGKRIYQI